MFRKQGALPSEHLQKSNFDLQLQLNLLTLLIKSEIKRQQSIILIQSLGLHFDQTKEVSCFSLMESCTQNFILHQRKTSMIIIVRQDLSILDLLITLALTIDIIIDVSIKSIIDTFNIIINITCTNLTNLLPITMISVIREEELSLNSSRLTLSTCNQAHQNSLICSSRIRISILLFLSKLKNKQNKRMRFSNNRLFNLNCRNIDKRRSE